jgi:hypothetical protein
MTSTHRSVAYGGNPSAFPETQFLAAPFLAQSYLMKVARGYAAMRQRRAVIVGLARNVAHILPHTILRVERLGQLFADYRVVMYENDSADETLNILRDWSHGHRHVAVIHERHNDPVHAATRSLARARRMAYYRGRCQDYVLDHHGNFDHVIVVDTDLEGGWSYDGVANTFGHDGWDFVGSFGIIFRRQGLSPNRFMHYDAWAYREDEDFTPLSTATVNKILFERGEPLWPVTSCFGGLGVYRMQAYAAGAYDGSDVEHVTFHARIRQLGYDRLFLNPSQLTLYGRRHRSMDRWAIRILNVFGKLSGWSPTRWHFPALPVAESGAISRLQHGRRHPPVQVHRPT